MALFLRDSSLQKQPFMTAHFVHHCTLKSHDLVAFR